MFFQSFFFDSCFYLQGPFTWLFSMVFVLVFRQIVLKSSCSSMGGQKTNGEGSNCIKPPLDVLWSDEKMLALFPILRTRK